MLFFSYAVRSLVARARANVLTMLAIALFIAGSSTGLTYYLALNRLLVETAPPENIIVIAKGAPTEAASRLPLDTALKLGVLEGVKRQGDVAVAARELVSRVYLESPDAYLSQEAVPIRGMDATSLAVHRVTVVDGKPPAPGSLEVMLGKRAAATYGNLKIGDELPLPAGKARVSGVFTADGGPFEDEVWTPREALELHIKNKIISSVTLVAEDAAHARAVIDKINASKDINAQASTVAEFRKHGGGLDKVATTVLVLLIILSIVACSAIATTMNAAVQVRLPELAALVAIGIRKSMLARAVRLESLCLAIVGAVVGVLGSIALRAWLGAVVVGDNPVQLTSSPRDVAFGLALGVVVGIVGGVWPARTVRRLDLLQAMR